MKKLIAVCAVVAIIAGFVFGQDLKNTDTPKPKASATSALDFTAEEAQQLKEIANQRGERQKEQQAAGQAVATAKENADMVSATLRYQLATERLTTLQLAEMLTVLNAKVRVNCLDCEYKGGTLVKPEQPAKK